MATTFYATNNFTGDGTTVNWNINFADGYIDTTNVKARYLDNTGSYVDIAISSVAGNVVTISPAVANGQEFQIYRDTEKRFPLVDFSDGAILNETNLDTLATQAVMVSAEAFDQSNNGVRIAGDSLVVAQGIDAKATEALDNSEAAVATANAIDGKAQTALDSSAAAVVTANAAASTAAGAVNTANTALATANDAADDAATAITTANGAVTTANAATATANAASAAAAAATTTANNAANDAAAAVSTAGTALSTANTASTNASAAVATANDAKTTAEGIEAKADSALAASANAVSTANAAEATANAIDGKATDALNTADSAEATANAAAATASSAAADASTALSTVSAADAKAQTALDNTVALDTATMKKAANLSDIADKAAAWLNVRPIGSTPLAGDPVGDYDATTKRWVENLINSGTVGPTMNGVMNYGVGDFHLRDSRAYKQPYEVYSDGQLLNRADWPELWAYAQMLTPITDAAWLADPQQRGKYSLGNGTTTFRVPDRNGVQVGSIRELFGRGDGGTSSNDGVIYDSAAPNIRGKVAGVSAGTYAGIFGTSVQDSFYTDNSLYPGGGGDTIPPGSGAVGGRNNTLVLDASYSNPVYGRYNISDNIIPRNFIGVWVIRASGGFVAANTSWSVKNADSSAPPLNTTVRGGEVISEYSNPTSTQFARLYSSSLWGSPNAAVIEAQGSATHAYKFYEDGAIDFRQSGKTNTFRMHTPLGTWNGITDADTVNLTTDGMDRIATTSGYDTLVRGYSIGGYRPDGYPTKVGFHMYLPGNSAFGTASVVIGGDNGKFCRYFLDIDGQIYGSTDYGNFSYTKNGASDYRVKHDISPVSVEKSYSNIQGLEFVEFIYNNDEQARVRHGIIAQQAETVEPLYVKTRKYVGINPGEIVEQKELDTTPMLLDTMHVVQTLMAKVEALEARIAELTSQ